MKKTILITTLIFNCLIINSQLTAQPTIQWQKSLGGSNNETANSVIQTLGGGYIVAGGTTSNDGDVTLNKGGTDCWVVKLDVNGNIQWQKTYGGSGDESISSILQTTDGGYIFAASSNSNDGDISNSYINWDYWIVKIDSVGNIQWEKSYGGFSSDIVEDIKSTIDGGYIAVGSSESNDGIVSINKGGTDYWVVKIDSIGNLEWQKSYGGSSGEGANSVIQTINGGYIMVGGSISGDGDITGNIGSTDYWVLKIDSIGNLLWEKNYGGSMQDAAYSVLQTQDNGFIVVGSSGSNDGDVTGHHGGIADDYWVIKLDSLGNLLWEKSLGGTFVDQAREVKQLNDGGYVILGTSASSDGDVSANYGNWDYWTVKIDSVGNIQWEKNLGGSFGDFGYAVDITTDNGIIVAGQSSSIDNDVINNIGFADFWVVKLNAVVGIEELGNESEMWVYPNPSRGIFTLNTKDNNGQVVIFDMMGRKLLMQYMNTTTQKIDISGFGKGTYIVKYTTDKNILTQKIIIN